MKNLNEAMVALDKLLQGCGIECVSYIGTYNQSISTALFDKFLAGELDFNNTDADIPFLTNLKCIGEGFYASIEYLEKELYWHLVWTSEPLNPRTIRENERITKNELELQDY